jgi:hypothetical protein
LLLVGAVGLYGQHVWRVFAGATVDDAAISYAYAHNVAHGHGWRATPGASPVEGFSNPLEVLVLVPCSLAGWDLDAAAKLSNIGFVALGLLAWGSFLLQRLRGIFRLTAVVPALATLLWPSFNYWTAAGLEGGMLVGLQMLTAWALLAGRRHRHGDLALGMLAGLLAWTRPEGAVYGAFAVAVALGSRPRMWRAAWAFLGCGMALVAWRYLVFRDVLPNTYWVKVGGEAAWQSGMQYVADFLKNNGKAYFLCLLPLLVPLSRAARPAGLVCLAQAAFAFYFAASVGGDWMRQWRFLQAWQGPMTSLIALGLFAALAPGAKWVCRRVPLWLRAAVAAALLAPLVFVNRPLGDVLARARATSQQRDLDMRRIGVCAGFYREFGEKLRLGRRLLMADVDVGGMMFPPGLEVVDMGGLTDRQIGRWWRRRPAAIVDYLFGERRPDTIHLHGSWLSARPVQALSPFAADYREMGSWFQHDLRVGPLTVIRAELVDPPAPPVLRTDATVGSVVIEGVSAYTDARRSVLFLHGVHALSGPLPALQWVDREGKAMPVLWHGGYDVEPGPLGAMVVGRSEVEGINLPLRLEGSSLVMGEWPVMTEGPGTLLGAARLPLLRLVGAPLYPCWAADLVDPRAPAAARARGMAWVAKLCGSSLDGPARQAFAAWAWSEAGKLRSDDDRYDLAAGLWGLGSTPSIGQRAFLDAARAGHTAYDEVLSAWAERELGSGRPSPGAIRAGLGILLAARAYERILLVTLGRGWLGMPEANGAFCAAAAQLGLRAEVVAAAAGDCQGMDAASARLRRQDFEDAKDASLQLTGGAEAWIREAGNLAVRGGRGRRRLQTPAGDKRNAQGEVVWGPLPWPGHRFGLLLAGGGAGSVVIVDMGRPGKWREVLRTGRTGSAGVLLPYLYELPRDEGAEVRVRIVDLSAAGGFVVDDLVFIAAP